MAIIGDPCWSFPILNGLLTGADGVSSASNFRGDPLKSIGKENLQNPIDARLNKSKPVFVEFSVFTLPIDQFPDHNHLKHAIHQSKATASPEGNSREESFFSSAEKYISLESIPFMRISDSNTTGLTGSSARTNHPEEIRESAKIYCLVDFSQQMIPSYQQIVSH